MTTYAEQSEFDRLSQAGSALHDNVDGELAAIANKSTPAGNDIFVIEDSAASNAKKRLRFSAVESTLSHDSLADYVANEHKQVLVVRKTSDTDRSSTTTFADDPDLVITPTTDTNYIFDAVIFGNGDVTPDIKYEFGGPASNATIKLATWGGQGSSNTSRSFKSTTTFNQSNNWLLGATGTTHVYRISGIITIGSTAGDIAFRWAQRVSNLATCTIEAGSYMRMESI